MNGPRELLRRGLLSWGLLAAATTWPGCIASNVVATEDRLVVQPAKDLAFTPAHDLAPAGLYESVEISGDAAMSLRKVYYLFMPDGTYTAAALTETSTGPSFQTLNGTWTSTAAGLSLDAGEPVPIELAPGHLRITAKNGVLVLRSGSLL
ncbi:MAG TPA: hypothetical protein VFT55_11580 [Planctomycetota bacterium]|nr:hypothetical protein [Planctomycetota bacterium]